MKVILEHSVPYMPALEVRDYFASKIMLHFMSDKKLSTTLNHYEFLEKVSKLSYEYADAMIKARESTK